MVDGIGGIRRGIAKLVGIDDDRRATNAATTTPRAVDGPRAAASPDVVAAARLRAGSLDRAAGLEMHRSFAAAAFAQTDGVSGTALDTGDRDPRTWWAGRPLSEAVNAHHTNTREDFEDALDSDANWFEGDVRVEINEPHEHEMRHDAGHESGDNLTLEEWLRMGGESGRGLKLDIKEADRMPEILDEVEAADIPDERLMFNLQMDDMQRWGPEIRARFPGAILAINPSTDDGGDSGPLDDAQIDEMIAQAERLGPPVTFVIRHDQLTDEAIERLAPYGTISTWNSQSKGVDDPQAEAERLRARGVDGMIDLNDGRGVSELPGIAVDKAKNKLRDWLD